MMSKQPGLLYDVEQFIMTNGTIADRLRLYSSGVKISKEEEIQIQAELKSLMNNDGGIPFDLDFGNPSSVKVTAEILPLVLGFSKTQDALVQSMVNFLVSRQKSDGGFAEALILDPFIEDKYGSTWGREHYPVGKSITWLSGKSLEALCIAGYDNEERLRRARDFLLYLQHEDGHWPDYKNHKVSDPMATGNILPALKCVGIGPEHKVYDDGRAALFQHLIDSLENKSTYDMVDLTAVGNPKSEKEKEIINKGHELIVSTQSKDGGWTQLGSKKSDPELSSILTFVVNKIIKY
ncbi:MAG: hypothetical protein ACW97A_01625 [Candidatus Thorarchaeota archaeon]